MRTDVGSTAALSVKVFSPVLPISVTGGHVIYLTPQPKYMAATPESKVKKAIRKILDEHGAYYAMPIGTGYGRSGVPDFLVCVRGRFLAVEAKANGGKTTALQEFNLEKIRNSGGVAMVIDETNLGDLTKWMKQN